MFTWGKALLLALSLVSSLVSYMRERNLLKQAEEKLLADFIKWQQEIINEANKVREQAATDAARVPTADSLPTDGYRRD